MSEGKEGEGRSQRICIQYWNVVHSEGGIFFLTGDRNQSRFDPGLSLGNRTFLNPTVCIYQVGIIVLTPFHSLYLWGK